MPIVGDKPPPKGDEKTVVTEYDNVSEKKPKKIKKSKE